MSNNLRWPIVLFDLDGTLANTIPLIIASYQHTFRKMHGIEVSETEAKSWIGRPLLDFFEENYPEQGASLTAEYRAWNEAHIEELIESYDGTAELCDELVSAGLRVGVVTSKMRHMAKWTMELTGFGDGVELLVGTEDTHAHKPNPEPLLRALEMLEATPEDAIYVGDAIFDIQAAQAAGMEAIAVTWGAGHVDALEAQNPDYLVNTVAELRELLLG